MSNDIEKGTPLHSILLVALKTKFDGNCLDEIMEIIQTHKYPIVAAEVVLGISQEPNLADFAWYTSSTKRYAGYMLVGYDKWASQHSKVRYREIVQPTEKWRVPTSIGVANLVDQETGVRKDKDELRALGYIHQYDDAFDSDEDLYEYFHKVEVITSMPYVRTTSCSVDQWERWVLGVVLGEREGHNGILKEFSNFTIPKSPEDNAHLIDNHNYDIWGNVGLTAPDFSAPLLAAPLTIEDMPDEPPELES